MRAVDLRQQIRTCTNCTLCSTGAGPVPFRGVRSDIMVVGEAPGKVEDEEGIPFVGPAGQLLWRELSRLGISSDTVFTANAVSCWPDRMPHDDEVWACQHNLFAQIRYCNPLWVLALGRIANLALGMGEPMFKLHGNWYRYLSPSRHQADIFPTYHPSAILRNQTLTRTWRRDLKKFGEATLGYGYEEAEEL